jgi:hypothetical protein
LKDPGPIPEDAARWAWDWMARWAPADPHGTPFDAKAAPRAIRAEI